MITKRNQACFAELASRGFQEEELNRCAVEKKIGT